MDISISKKSKSFVSIKLSLFRNDYERLDSWNLFQTPRPKTLNSLRILPLPLQSDVGYGIFEACESMILCTFLYPHDATRNAYNHKSSTQLLRQSWKMSLSPDFLPLLKDRKSRTPKLKKLSQTKTADTQACQDRSVKCDEFHAKHNASIELSCCPEAISHCEKWICAKSIPTN